MKLALFFFAKRIHLAHLGYIFRLKIVIKSNETAFLREQKGRFCRREQTFILKRGLSRYLSVVFSWRYRPCYDKLGQLFEGLNGR